MIGFTRDKTLDEQRYQRLKECVAEYLDDEGENPKRLVSDVKLACQELKKYHSERLDAFNTVENSLNV